MNASAFFAPLIATLRREAAEDAGLAPALDRPCCPKCRSVLVCYYGRNSKQFRIDHGIDSNGDCPLRFETFGTGADEDAAWADAKLQLNKTDA